MTSRALPFSSAVRAVAQPSAGALTPASVALLVNNWDAQAIDIARRAIASDDPAIRAVQRRLAGSTGSAALADAIATALEREKDPLVAVEQARALLFLRGAAAEELIKARFATSSEIANGLCRMAVQGTDPRRSPMLCPRSPRRSATIASSSIPTCGPPWTGGRSRASGCCAPGSAQALQCRGVRSSDRLLIDPSRPGQDTVLIEALNSKDAGTREATVWNSWSGSHKAGRCLRPYSMPRSRLVVRIRLRP